MSRIIDDDPQSRHSDDVASRASGTSQNNGAMIRSNTPTAYLVPASAWEALMERLDDLALAQIVREREGQEEIEVSIDDL